MRLCGVIMTPKGGFNMSEEEKRFTLRMPTELFDKLKVIADDNYRAVSKEIIIAIEEYLKKNQDSQ